MSNNYVDNEAFTQAVIEYADKAQERLKIGAPIPQVTDYLGQSLLAIAEGIAKNKKFRKRSYREDLVMDAFENCLKALPGYDWRASTRSGKPNAFGYFSRVCYNAMLRRVIRETEEYNTKLALAYQLGIELTLESEEHKPPELLEYLDQLQSQYFKANLTSKEKKAKRKKPPAGGLTEFLEE